MWSYKGDQQVVILVAFLCLCLFQRLIVAMSATILNYNTGAVPIHGGILNYFSTTKAATAFEINYGVNIDLPTIELQAPE